MNNPIGDERSSSSEARTDALAYARSITDAVREPLLILDRDLRVQSANRPFCRTFRASQPDTEGRLLYEIGHGQWNIPRLRTLLEEVLVHNTAFDDFEVEHDFPGLGWKVMLLNARRFRQEGVEGIVLALEDVTEQRRRERECRETATRFTSLLKNVEDHSIFTLDLEGRVTNWNGAAENILGYTEAEALGRHFSFIFTPEDCQRGLPESELRMAREQGRADDERWHMRKDGERFWALGVISALHDTGGRLTGFSKILRDMTERKLTEGQLRAARDAFRQVVDQSPFGVYTVDADFRLMQISVGAQNAFRNVRPLIGRDFGEVLGLLWPEPFASELIARFRHTLATGEPYHAPTTILPRWGDADTESYDWKIERITLADGRPGVLCHFYDLSERHQYEEALRESEARFRTMSDGLPLMVWVHDAKGRQEFVNCTFCEFFGVSTEEAAGDGWKALMHPDDAGAYAGEFQKCVQAQRPFHAEVRVQAADGKWHWLESWGRPRFGPSGTFLGVVGTSADVTARKRAEEALRRNEARYRELLDNANSAILRWSRDGTITYFNEYAERLFGYSAAEVVGRHAGVLLPDQESTGHDLSGLITDIAAHPERHEQNVNENLCRDGRRLWMIWTNKPVVDAEGHLVEILCVGTDITKLKAAEAALQEADRRKDAFLATLAHELRNPLAPIRTGLDLVDALRGDAAACEEPIQIMNRQLSHLVRLVDDLLDVSRISRGKIQLRKERLDLAEIIDDALDMSGSGLSQGDRQLTLSVPSKPLMLEGDRVRLVQIIANLLNNAVKFTEPGGRIDVRVMARGERVEIQVQDDGRGIPREQLDNIFEMFSQAESDRTSGLGIGLSLVRELVEMHAGTVTAVSEGPGRGASFSVDLPLCRSAVAPAPEATDAAMGHGILPTQCRVLVVDDDQDIVKSLELLLTMLGAEVRVARDGAEAVRIFGDWPPTHVLMDIGMPGMDGYEVARRLRADHADQAFRLIAVTGWGQEEDRQRALEAGFDEHLVKPLRLERLKEVLSA